LRKVIDGGAHDIDVMIRDPRRLVLYATNKLSDGYFEAVAEYDGPHEVRDYFFMLWPISVS
jgi:hypothetical protein